MSAFLAANSDLFIALQSLFTIFAIVIGGVWFMLQRRRYPRANFGHQIAHFPIDDNKVLLRVTVEIANHGDRLLAIDNGQVDVHKIKPWPHHVLGKNMDDHPVIIQLVDEPTEESWTLLRCYTLTWASHRIEIEPGEREQLHFDIFIRPDAEILKIQSHFANNIKRKWLLGPKTGIGWSTTTIYELQPDGK